MTPGKVKFYKAGQGYGFLIPDDGGPDVFVHAKELRTTGIRDLAEGQAVQFEAAPGRDGRPKAMKIELVR